MVCWEAMLKQFLFCTIISYCIPIFECFISVIPIFGQHLSLSSDILLIFMISSHSPGDDPDCAGGVKTLVMKQVRSYKKLMPKKSFYEHPLPGLDSSRNQSTENIGDAVNQPLGTSLALLFFYNILQVSLLWNS